MDLVDIQALSENNDGMRYIMTVIDCFTRYAWAKLLPDKTGSVVLNAFKQVLDEAETKPYNLVIDGGAEFRNQAFLNFCRANSINIFDPDSSTHGAFIERFNRTLQNLIYKYLSENSTYKFTTVFDSLMLTYNRRKHRMTGFSPIYAEENEACHLEIRMKMSKYYEKIKTKIPNLKLGDMVRISKIKGKFARGYKATAQEEIFRIYKINIRNKIPLYYLENYNSSEKIKGGFYEFEITKNTQESFQVEKVLKKRKRKGVNEILVKWVGYDDTYNSWIPETDVTRKY